MFLRNIPDISTFLSYLLWLVWTGRVLHCLEGHLLVNLLLSTLVWTLKNMCDNEECVLQILTNGESKLFVSFKTQGKTFLFLLN